jgi:hypothetical protein
MYGIVGLVLAAVAAAGSRPRVLAQEVPFVPIDCGPVGVFPGDVVALNVGNATKGAQAEVVLHARLFDAEGVALVDRSLTLAAGQSRSVSVRLAETGLVRGEVVPVTGPDELRLKASVQVTRQQRLRLTYGPHFECAGPTGSRPPA